MAFVLPTWRAWRPKQSPDRAKIMRCRRLPSTCLIRRPADQVPVRNPQAGKPIRSIGSEKAACNFQKSLHHLKKGVASCGFCLGNAMICLVAEVWHASCRHSGPHSATRSIAENRGIEFAYPTQTPLLGKPWGTSDRPPQAAATPREIIDKSASLEYVP